MVFSFQLIGEEGGMPAMRFSKSQRSHRTHDEVQSFSRSHLFHVWGLPDIFHDPDDWMSDGRKALQRRGGYNPIIALLYPAAMWL